MSIGVKRPNTQTGTRAKRCPSDDVEEQRVDVVLDLVTPPEERPALGHGFAVFLHIVEWEADDVLQVPLSALFRESGEWALFVHEAGTARQRRVEVGRINDTTAEITGGLEEGQEVMLHPNRRIEDGSRVALRSDSEE